MATYAELLQAQSNEALRARITVALIVAADKVRAANPQPANHALRLSWAGKVLRNVNDHVDAMIKAVVAQNRQFTLAQITNADDAAVQTAVDNAVDLFADTGA